MPAALRQHIHKLVLKHEPWLQLPLVHMHGRWRAVQTTAKRSPFHMQKRLSRHQESGKCDLQVTLADLKVAETRVQPSAMREVALEV